MPKSKTNALTGGLVVKHRFNLIVAQVEQQRGMRLTDAQISRETNISKPTIAAYRNPSPLQKFDNGVLAALCHWAGCELSDLLYLEKETAS